MFHPLLMHGPNVGLTFSSWSLTNQFLKRWRRQGNQFQTSILRRSLRTSCSPENWQEDWRAQVHIFFCPFVFPALYALKTKFKNTLLVGLCQNVCWANYFHSSWRKWNDTWVYLTSFKINVDAMYMDFMQLGSQFADLWALGHVHVQVCVARVFINLQW